MRDQEVVILHKYMYNFICDLADFTQGVIQNRMLDA